MFHNLLSDASRTYISIYALDYSFRFTIHVDYRASKCDIWSIYS